MFGFFQRIGPLEVVVILAVILIIFGPSKLPGLAKAVGKSVAELKEGLRGKPAGETPAPSEKEQG